MQFISPLFLSRSFLATKLAILTLTHKFANIFDSKPKTPTTDMFVYEYQCIKTNSHKKMVFLRKFCGLPPFCILFQSFFPQSERYPTYSISNLYSFLQVFLGFDQIFDFWHSHNISWCILYLKCFWEEQITNMSKGNLDNSPIYWQKKLILAKDFWSLDVSLLYFLHLEQVDVNTSQLVSLSNNIRVISLIVDSFVNSERPKSDKTPI